MRMLSGCTVVSWFLCSLTSFMALAEAPIEQLSAGESPRLARILPRVKAESEDVPLFEAAKDALDLRAASIQSLGFASRTESALTTAIVVDENIWTLELQEYSNRSPDFEVWVQDESGRMTLVEAPPVQTYVGTVLELPGSAVRASYKDGEIEAVVYTSDGVFGVQPLSRNGVAAGVGEHAVYRAADWVNRRGYSCGTDVDRHLFGGMVDVHAVTEHGSNAASTLTHVAQIALDADFEFFQLNSSNVNATILDMESIINGMQSIYESQLNITYEISSIVVRTSAASPYTATNSSTLLGQLVNHWNASPQSSVPRDLLHLFTGKNLDGSVIGVAYIGTVCNLNWAYGLSQSRFTSSMAARIALTAHEVGHNWKAQHCNGCSGCSNCCRIMCSNLGGCPGGITSFGCQEIDQISAFRDTRTCLDLIADGGCTTNADCDDGIYCNGAEWCHPTLGCYAGSPPNCNDGVACTMDSCNESLRACQNILNHNLCNDGLYCNGVESCHPTLGCQSGIPVNCNDGVACTVDTCNEATDSCNNVPNNASCSDGLFCNGAEVCHATLGCQPGSNPCPGQSCNELTDSCVSVECFDDADCNQGLFCSGQKTCVAGSCVVAQSGGVVNGTFDGGGSWVGRVPVGGTITFPGTMRVVGPNNSSQGFAWAIQSGIVLNGSSLEFDLLSYSSTDSGAWDYPVFSLNGVFYGLNANGTLGPPTTGSSSGAGTISNGNPVASPVHFVVNVNTLAGHAGPHIVGLGVASADGRFGAGTAVFDNVTPAFGVGGGDPCPGQLCDESTQSCVDCLSDADCDDGLFCNGWENCVDGSCELARFGGVGNGTFDGGASWNSNTPNGGTITYPGSLRVVGPNQSVRAFAWAGQGDVSVGNGVIAFDLLSYSSSDTGPYDYPVFYLNGTYRPLNANGTLGGPTTGTSTGTGTINNGNQVSSAIHFLVNINALAGHSGPHTIGFGVASVDGRFGAGTAVFDNVLPPMGSGEPCPGQSCDEVNDACIP